MSRRVLPAWARTTARSGAEPAQASSPNDPLAPNNVRAAQRAGHAAPRRSEGAPGVDERDPLAARFRKGRRASYREGALFGAMAFGSVALAALIGSILTSRLYGVDAIGAYSLAVATITALRL